MQKESEINIPNYCYLWNGWKCPFGSSGEIINCEIQFLSVLWNNDKMILALEPPGSFSYTVAGRTEYDILEALSEPDATLRIPGLMWFDRTPQPVVPLNNDFLDCAKIILLGTVRTGEGETEVDLSEPIRLTEEEGSYRENEKSWPGEWENWVRQAGRKMITARLGW